MDHRERSLLPSELKHNVRLIGWLTMQKFCVAVMILYMLQIFKPLVYKDLGLMYQGFCAIVSIYIISPSATNPGLSVWQAYYLLFKRIFSSNFFASEHLTVEEKPIIK